MLDKLDKKSIKRLVDYANLNKLGILVLAKQDMRAKGNQHQQDLMQYMFRFSAFFLEKYNLSDFKYVVMNQEIDKPTSLPIFIPLIQNIMNVKNIPISIEYFSRLFLDFERNHVEYCIKRNLPILIYNPLQVSRFYYLGMLGEPHVFIANDNTQYPIPEPFNFVEFYPITNKFKFDKMSFAVKSKFLCVYVKSKGLLTDEIIIDPLHKELI